MIEDRVADIIRRELNLPSDQEAGTLAYGAVPEWSSSSHMNVIIAVEEEYGIEFSPDDIAELTSLPKIAAAVTERTGQAA